MNQPDFSLLPEDGVGKPLLKAGLGEMLLEEPTVQIIFGVLLDLSFSTQLSSTGRGKVYPGL